MTRQFHGIKVSDTSAENDSNSLGVPLGYVTHIIIAGGPKVKFLHFDHSKIKGKRIPNNVNLDDAHLGF